METFDWRSFLELHGIPYIESGKNVASGNINIKCPFCRDDDPSEHMGINIENGYWGCWRDDTHRGKAPHRLIAQLLGYTRRQVLELLGQFRTLPDDEDMINAIRAISNENRGEDRSIARNKLSMPKTFWRYSEIPSEAMKEQFKRYLIGRGFKHNRIERVCNQYDIRFCISDPLKNRIIFPITKNNSLYTWTSRSIGSRGPKYKTLSHKSRTVIAGRYYTAVGSIKDCVYRYDHVIRNNAEFVFICEGVFDAIKFNYLADRVGLSDTFTAVCVFGKVTSTEQEFMLMRLQRQGRKLILLLDENTTHDALRICSRFGRDPVSILTLPEDIKDPGSLTKRSFIKLIGSMNR